MTEEPLLRICCYGMIRPCPFHNQYTFQQEQERKRAEMARQSDNDKPVKLKDFESEALADMAADYERRSGEDRRKFDEIQKAQHYNSHASGIECIDVARHDTFNVGTCKKYLWRHGLKGDENAIKDLKKAIYYLNDEVKRFGGETLQMEQERVLRHIYQETKPIAKTYEIWFDAMKELK